MFTLYKLTFTNKKIYVGQTVRKIITRITQHRQSVRNNSQLAVHCAWRKYGEPICEIIGTYDNENELHIAEINAIKELNSLCPNGYNIGFGGETAPSKNKYVAKKISEKASGRSHTNETIKIISKASSDRWKDENYRNKVMDGVDASWTPEAREARSKMMKLRWEELKKNGYVVSEETKLKIKNKALNMSDATRKKMSMAAKGKNKPPRTQETKAKLAKSVTEKWKDSEHRIKRINSIKNAWTQEVREAMSNKMKLAWEKRKYNKILNKE